MILNSLRWLKNKLVPDRVSKHRILFGPARGNYLPLNLKIHLRVQLGLYEREIAGIVRELIKPGDVCYDIGSNVGYYTTTLAKLAYPGKVFGFEPDDRIFPLLQSTLRWNRRLRPTINIFPYFLGDNADGKRRFTLDLLVYKENFPPPDFIKMDIEGAEIDTLRGAERLLKEHSPKFVIETHGKDIEDQCIGLLRSNGYEVTVIDQNALISEHRPLDHNRWIAAVKEKVQQA